MIFYRKEIAHVTDHKALSQPFFFSNLPSRFFIPGKIFQVDGVDNDFKWFLSIEPDTRFFLTGEPPGTESVQKRLE